VSCSDLTAVTTGDLRRVCPPLR